MKLLISLSIVSVFLSSASTWAMGSGRRDEDNPVLRTRAVPAHSSLIPLQQSWQTSTRELNAYALVLEKMLWFNRDDSTRVDQHWVDFQPSPLADQAIQIIPDRLRVRTLLNGKPDFVITKENGIFHLAWRMSLGLFGRDRLEIQRLAIQRGVSIKMADFDRSAFGWDTRVRPTTPLRVEGFSGDVSMYRSADQVDFDPWVAVPYVYASARMTPDQFREFRRRMNRQGEPVSIRVDYTIGVSRAAQPGSQPVGDTGRVNTITEWIAHQAEGVVACIHIDRSEQVEADRSGDCAQYWE